jgi:four helix bundle protein
MSSPTFESLRVWHDARDLVSRVYSMTRASAFASDFALRDQIRRAALSVMSNIAEGHERSGNREFVHFLAIAKSSCGEVRSQLYVAEDVGYIRSSDAAELRGAAANLSRKIQALAASRKGKGEPLCGKQART